MPSKAPLAFLPNFLNGFGIFLNMLNTPFNLPIDLRVATILVKPPTIGMSIEGSNPLNISPTFSAKSVTAFTVLSTAFLNFSFPLYAVINAVYKPAIMTASVKIGWPVIADLNTLNDFDKVVMTFLAVFKPFKATTEAIIPSTIACNVVGSIDDINSLIVETACDI